MSCKKTLAGLMRDCVPSVGGIKEVLMANYSDVTVVAPVTEKISEITLAEASRFYKYEFRQGTGSMTSTENIDPVSNTRYVSTDLVLQFNHMDTEKRKELEAVTTGELAVIVKDNNGKYWYLGFDEPVLATAGDGSTGTARGDANKYGITLQDNSHLLPYEVDESIIANLLSPAA